MEFITQIIAGSAILLSLGVLVIFIGAYPTMKGEAKTEHITTTPEVESFLDIDMDTLLSETKIKDANVQELKKKLNQFENRNRFYNL
jgi:hypothetical protein